MDNELDSLTKLFTHWDSNYWYAAYIFLIVQGAFIVAFAEIYTQQNLDYKEEVVLGISSLGLLFSILWIFVLNRKISYTHSSEHLIFKKINALKEEIDELQRKKWYRLIPSSIIVQTVFPLVLIIWWTIVLFLYPKIWSILIILFSILIIPILYIKFGSTRSKEHS